MKKKKVAKKSTLISNLRSQLIVKSKASTKKPSLRSIATPVAPMRPQRLTIHGDTRTDKYFWLREKKDPATMKYLKQENAYFEEKLKPLTKIKKQLFTEMKSRIKEDDSSPPAPYDGYFYYSKFQKGKQYPLNCRRLGKKGPEEIILDGNKIAKGQKYYHSTGLRLSTDQQCMGYSADFNGSERYHIFFKDLSTGKILPDTLKNCSGSFTWANDNRTLFYVVIDKNLRPFQVYRHILGQKTKKDQLMYEEKDPQHFVHLDKTNSDEYIIIDTSGKVTSETWILAADRPMDDFRCFQPRQEGLEYSVEHRGDQFWILTNLKATNFQVMTTPTDKTLKKNWQTFLPNSDKIFREGLSLFANYLVLSERVNGLPQITVHDFWNNKSHAIAFDDAAYTASVGTNMEYDTDVLRFNYSSPITPDSVIDYNMETTAKKVVKVREVKGHKKSAYACERVWVSGHDGAKIPMTITYRKGVKLNSTAPGYLYGYGSYGANIPDSFPGHRDIFRLIDRGYVYALAHPRGGSEMGRQWYEDGKFLKKKNTFLDFIACADYLIKKKYVAAGKLAACGGSAGGMLMGACMNMRPDLFNVIVAHVPFVDVINTMLDKDLPLTQIEYKEWGNPEEKKYYHYMKSYSPYDNVEAKAYPHMFVTCGLNDPRVTYWEPAKWVAKLRELKIGDSEIVFKTNMGFGHFGASGRFEHLHEQAEEYAFILNKFGNAK